MQFDCKAGDTAFILDDSPSGGHTYIVLTPPNKNGFVVRANFTSAEDRVPDGTVFTHSDDEHLFRQRTIVHYRRADIYPSDKLCFEANRQNVVNRYKPCPQNIMKQIIEDAFKSQFIKGDVIEELRACYPIEYDQYYEDPNQE